MSRDGLFWERAARVNEGGTPTAALLATTAASLVFLFTGTFEKALAVTTFFVVLNYAVSFLAVFVLRRREPNAERPYRAWGYPGTSGAALVGAVAFLAGAVVGDTGNSLYALLALAASYPGFLLTRWLARRQRRTAAWQAMRLNRQVGEAVSFAPQRPPCLQSGSPMRTKAAQ
jgi:APA family basic amino acid/polyamine antiporter